MYIIIHSISSYFPLNFPLLQSQASDEILREHPHPHRLTTYLGLEAKNLAVVCADADLGTTVREVTTGALAYNGQRCTALKLIMVHKSVVQSFLSKLIPAVEALKAGLPMEPGVSITALPEGTKKVMYTRYNSILCL